MKKIILILLLVTSVITAQENSEFENSKFHYGLKLGLAMSTISSDNLDRDTIDSKFGIEIGALFSYYLNDLLTIQTELLFTQKGYVFLSSEVPDTHFTLNYLQLPITFGFKLFSEFKLYFGAYFSSFTNIWVSSSSLTYDQESDYEDELEPKINNFDMGGILGFTFRGNNNILFDFRYERSIISLYNEGDDTYSSSFKLSAAWLF